MPECYWEQEYDAGNLNSVRAEQALWRAVITQALMDASSRSRKMEAKYEKSQALCWLTGFGDDFKTVCDFAGFNPDYIRENSIEALKRDCKWRADGEFTRAREEESAPRPHAHPQRQPAPSLAWMLRAGNRSAAGKHLLEV